VSWALGGWVVPVGCPPALPGSRARLARIAAGASTTAEAAASASNRGRRRRVFLSGGADSRRAGSPVAVVAVLVLAVVGLCAGVAMTKSGAPMAASSAAAPAQGLATSSCSAPAAVLAAGRSAGSVAVIALSSADHPPGRSWGIWGRRCSRASAASTGVPWYSRRPVRHSSKTNPSAYTSVGAPMWAPLTCSGAR